MYAWSEWQGFADLQICRCTSNIPEANRPVLHRVKVKDNNIGKDTLAAWACIKLNRLKSGYRFIRLLDAWGMESSGVLLVRIVKIFS